MDKISEMPEIINSDTFELELISLYEIESIIMDAPIYHDHIGQDKSGPCPRLKELINNNDLKDIAEIIHEKVMAAYKAKQLENKIN